MSNLSVHDPTVPPVIPLAPKRPVAVTVICVLGFISFVLIGLLASKILVRDTYAFQPYYLALNAVVVLSCTLGLWRMQRWAVFAYAVFSVADQILQLTIWTWHPVGTILPIATNAVGFLYLSRMR